MLVANSFDLWQKDTFFSAAEEVQESADTMESAYRRWDRERREGPSAQDLDELCRELQTALGTAKWQLEEFERAVRLSYRRRSDDTTTARHRQFVTAIEDQISRVEAALREFFNGNNKQPLRWVKLDEQECDDLAAFLSGNGSTKIETSTTSSPQEMDYTKKAAHIVTSEKDFEHGIELGSKEIPRTRDDTNSPVERTSGTRRTWSSPDIGSWKIAIPDEDAQRKALLSSFEVTPKERGSKHITYTQLRGINWFNQILGRVRGRQRQLDSPRYLQFSCSMQLKLAIFLTMFLMVPFVLYST